MTHQHIPGRRLFVIDTNVLMHDPAALFRFKEHDIFLPMVVLEELDHAKKGVSEVSRNVRQVSRFIDGLIQGRNQDDISRGLPLQGFEQNGAASSGKLYFQVREMPAALPNTLPGTTPDNTILGTALALQQTHPDQPVTLVSKDINLRIKATVLGIHAEDYFSDQVLDDVNLLFGGTCVLPADFWQTHSKEMDSWTENGRTFYRLSGPLVAEWHPSQFLYLAGGEPFEAIVRKIEAESAVIETVPDFRASNHSVWGISALNREQNYALAAGLAQCLDTQLYREIIMTRITVPVGEDIGFLPGTEEEKMTPWMGALMDNLEVLTQVVEGGEWGRAATNDLVRNKVKIRSVNFMRGRTFLNRYIILDEAQNLTPKQMKTLITRAGPGTKIVCVGNIAQIDTPYLTETTSGLTYVVDRFKDWPHSGHITLLRGERSRLADFASSTL